MKLLLAHKRITALAIVLVIALFFYLRSRSPSTATPQYQTAQVERGTLIVSITGSGQVSNANSGSISTQASGVVTKIFVKNGDSVKQGTAIAEMQLDQNAMQNFA